MALLSTNSVRVRRVCDGGWWIVCRVHCVWEGATSIRRAVGEHAPPQNLNNYNIE